MWKNTRVLVTGGTGFLGKHLVKRLASLEADVCVITSRSSDKKNHLQVDVANAQEVLKAFQAFRPQIVFHLASYGVQPDQKDEEQMNAVNVDGTKNILQACKEISVENIIMAGSWTEYGSIPAPFAEQDEARPISPYGLSKLRSTQLAQAWSLDSDIPLTVLRFASLFGPDEPLHRLIPTLAQSSKTHEPAILNDPSNVRDFLYVEDAINACLLAGQTQLNGEILNVGSGQGISIQEVVKTAKKVFLGLPEPVWKANEPRPWDVASAYLAIEKAKVLLNWQAQTSLEAGLTLSLKG